MRTELSKATWLFNKGLGGGTTCAISVDDDSLHVSYLASGGSGIELYLRAYDPSTDAKMAADFKHRFHELFTLPELCLPYAPTKGTGEQNNAGCNL